MESTELYHIKQQFTLGAYKSLVDLTLPEESSPEYTPTLLTKARAHIALNDAAGALSILPEDSDNVAVKAARALARAVEGLEKDAALEELRDLCVEIEGEDVSEKDKGLVRVLAGTAFAREGEVEEALETLGVGTDSENLEATALIVQIYLSIHRVDLAKKEFDQAKRWAEDDLLLQLIEASIGLVTGAGRYNNPYSFYNEQLANPSLTSPHLLTARGITRILRGEVVEARSDFEEAMQSGVDAETLAAAAVAAGLGAGKKVDAEQLWSRLTTEFPQHPLVLDIAAKGEAFDTFAAAYTVPPPVQTAA